MPLIILNIVSDTNNNTDNVDTFDASTSSGDFLSNIEADTYWCLSKFLDGIQVPTAQSMIYFILFLFYSILVYFGLFYFVLLFRTQQCKINMKSGLLYICTTRNTKNDLQVA
jgi:hypothetical protein